MYGSDLKQYLPSKKIIVLAGIIFVGFVSYFGFENRSLFLSEPSNSAATTSPSAEDNSFLPNQQRPENSFSTTRNTTSSDNLTNQTEASVAPRALALAAAQENGEEISDRDIERVAESMSADISLENPKTYEVSDFTTTNASQQQIQDYANTLVSTLTEQMNRNQSGGPLAILSAHLQNQESADLSQIDQYIQNNQQIISELLNLTVPSSYAELHKQLINNLSAANTNLKRMKQVDTDPVMATIGIKKYRQVSNQGLSLSDQIAQKFNQDLQ